MFQPLLLFFDNFSGGIEKRHFRESQRKGSTKELVWSLCLRYNKKTDIDVEQENLKISAYAKEGLFSQHTEEKAIDRLLQAL